MHPLWMYYMTRLCRYYIHMYAYYIKNEAICTLYCRQKRPFPFLPTTMDMAGGRVFTGYNQ